MIIYIPTLNRVGNQITLASVPERWKDRVFLVCRSEEKHEWTNRIDVPKECVGSISKTRQWIMDQSPGNHIGIIDDDVRFYKRDTDNKTKRHLMSDAGELFDLMESWLSAGEVYCGTSSSFMSQNNPDEYFFGKPSHCCFLNTQYMHLHNIRYDAIRYFEDFHVPLAVLESGHRLKYTGEWITQEKKANAPGGCSMTRDANNNRKAMFDLQKLHPKYIRLKDDPAAMNQNLVVGVKMTILFKKCFTENVSTNARLPTD